MTRGRFIVFDGPDGCGKSSQAKMLAVNIGAVLTREPGGTPVGSEIRSIVLKPGHVTSQRAELLLMLADRAEHVDTVIEPALAEGRDVVCDRYWLSSIVYQAMLGGLGDVVAELSAWAQAGLIPDKTIVLEVPAAERLRRRQARPGSDKFEQKPNEWHDQVAECFAMLTAPDVDSNALHVDGTGLPADVFHRVLEALEIPWGGDK